MEDNLMPFVFGDDFETNRLHEENKLLKQRIEQLQQTINSLRVSFVQETGREIAI